MSKVSDWLEKKRHVDELQPQRFFCKKRSPFPPYDLCKSATHEDQLPDASIDRDGQLLIRHSISIRDVPDFIKWLRDNYE